MRIRTPLTRERILGALRDRQDVLRQFRVRRIGLFGSYAKGKQSRTSDLDFIVEFDEPTFDNFMNLGDYLEQLFGKKVEILTPEGVKSIPVKSIVSRITRDVLYV